MSESGELTLPPIRAYLVPPEDDPSDFTVLDTNQLVLDESDDYNHKGQYYYTFQENGSYTFRFSDAAGNVGSILASVHSIDTTKPEVLSTQWLNQGMGLYRRGMERRPKQCPHQCPGDRRSYPEHPAERGAAHRNPRRHRLLPDQSGLCDLCGQRRGTAPDADGPEWKDRRGNPSGHYLHRHHGSGGHCEKRQRRTVCGRRQIHRGRQQSAECGIDLHHQ